MPTEYATILFAKKIKLRSLSCDQVQLVLFRSRLHLKLLEKNL